ncbi:MAG: type II toxin-antitoxin system RelE/ParE family toxin [Rhodospirillales bacterium]|nr:type II toxin-antitoxin system RelE/ParE family toxin [Rhodospirillales bacterium]MSP80457.1 type II toxin-antitoxin system RelE/ParE family toxin [Rhodospirillales bacterium]
MAWTVETLRPTVDDEIADLPLKVQAKLLWIMEQIEARGLPALRPPHIDHLGGGLYELRAKGQEGIGRALFVTRGERVIVVHAFQKKTQKTPARNLRLAIERAKETR